MPSCDRTAASHKRKERVKEAGERERERERAGSEGAHVPSWKFHKTKCRPSANARPSDEPRRYRPP
jgi:hypothetical protein